MKEGKKAKRNIYSHSVDLSILNIKNQPREKFRKLLEEISYKGYEVERLSDGRKIVITKPGGKFVFGTVKREDFMVWVYDEKDNSLWLISHKNIFEDLEVKGEKDKRATLKIINALEKVFNGEESDEILKEENLDNPIGENPELLMKAYKWIWGQEDCNYPTGEGREMSMKIIRELKKKLI
jgi:RecB family endonuclease NucS